MELMQTLDDAWNGQGVKVFRERHKPGPIQRHDVGPHEGARRSTIPPTGKSFDIDFYTVARWDDGQIAEENLMYDLVTFMKQIGLGT